jgi:hypothetical protein
MPTADGYYETITASYIVGVTVMPAPVCKYKLLRRLYKAKAVHQISIEGTGFVGRERESKVPTGLTVLAPDDENDLCCLRHHAQQLLENHAANKAQPACAYPYCRSLNASLHFMPTREESCWLSVPERGFGKMFPLSVNVDSAGRNSSGV